MPGPAPGGSDALRELRAPGLPGIRTAARTALVELWYHPWPALVANVAWAFATLAAVGVATIWPLLGLLLAPLVAIPFAGVMRVGTAIVRGESVAVHDVRRAWRTHGSRAARLGLMVTIGVLVLAGDVVIGLAAVGGVAGWALATAAGWALVGGALLLVHAWPLLLDPATDRGVAASLRLGARTAMLFPRRSIALALLVAAVLALSTILFATLATFAMAWIAILSSLVVLPAADRLTALEDRRG